VPLRMAEEGLSREQAVNAVLRDNLFGLEIDQRCTQLAAFNLAFSAWKTCGQYHQLPKLHIACSGIGPRASQEEWLKMAERTLESEPATAKEPIRRGLIHMHELFSGAPELGSLINPNDLPAEGFAADFETLQPVLDEILHMETDDAEAHERAVAAHGMAEAAKILSGRSTKATDRGEGYTLVITNVPYLGRGQQHDRLKQFADTNYKSARADLATVFVARMLRWSGRGANAGTVAAVTPQNWLFLTSYKKFRRRLLNETSWHTVARLGPGAFETISGHVVNVALLSISGTKPIDSHVMSGIDVAEPVPPAAKAALLRGESSNEVTEGPVAGACQGARATPAGDDQVDVLSSDEKIAEFSSDFNTASCGEYSGTVHLVFQNDQVTNPDATVMLTGAGNLPRLGDEARMLQGISTGDAGRFIMRFWEGHTFASLWSYYRMAPNSNSCLGCHSILKWEQGEGDLAFSPRARICGQPAWGQTGLTVAVNAQIPRTIYYGELFDVTAATLLPHNRENFLAIAAFVLDENFPAKVRQVDQALSVTESSFERVPFNRSEWAKIAEQRYPQSLPEPQSNDPTQWMFHGHPSGILDTGDAREPSAADILQVAVPRLLGYR